MADFFLEMLRVGFRNWVFWKCYVSVLEIGYNYICHVVVNGPYFSVFL